MFEIPDSYRVNSNNTDIMTNIKGPFELNSSPNNRTFWGLNQYGAIILCYFFDRLQRIYSVAVDTDTLRDYINGNISFKRIMQRNAWVDITDGQLYSDDLIKRYLFPVSEIPEYELYQMDYLIIAPPENKEFYLL